MGLFKRSIAVTSINFNCWRQDFRVKFILLFTALIVFNTLKPVLQYGLDNGSSIFSVLGLISMMPTFSAGTATPHMLMFLWGMLYPLTVYAFCAFFFARRLEWRKKHGLI